MEYPKIGESWRANWENIRTIFSYPAEIRHAIYTTNAIESLNSVIRHSTKKRKIFSSDDSVKKVIYLNIKCCEEMDDANTFMNSSSMIDSELTQNGIPDVQSTTTKAINHQSHLRLFHENAIT